VDIQINTDHNIEGHEALAADTTDVVGRALRRFSDHITRVEVHLGDENGPKEGQNDMRCMLEARIEGRPPIAVTHHADTIQLAVDGAANNLVALIENTLDVPEALRRAERQ
jgi:hypothetical protein